MKVKTFHALNMQDAIRAIKEELGPDAIILSSKEVQQGGTLLRLFNRPVLEVMAAAEEADQRKTPAPPQPSTGTSPSKGPARTPATPGPAPAFQETLQSMLKTAPTVAPAGPAVQPASAPRTRDTWKKERLRKLRGELQELSHLLGASLPPESQALGGHLPAELATCCRSLIRQGIRPSTAEALGRELSLTAGTVSAQSTEAIREGMQRLLAGRIRVSGPLLAGRGDRAISLMLGPSGAGKSTAVTKLAAHYRLEEKKSVAIITFDTYREASVEHMRTYAHVLGVPFASAVSARQVHEGLRRHAQADLVLIDLPGIGPDDVAAAKELHQLLQHESDMDSHLVIPASMREHDIRRIYERVKDLPSLRFLFTKLDETDSFGTMFELVHQTGVPLSYWSAGQRVPEDIELASPGRLADFLVHQRYAGPTDVAPPSWSGSSFHDCREPVTALTGQQER